MAVKLYKFNPDPSPWWCPSCGDSGLIEIYHPSTDALLYCVSCESCKGNPPPPVYKWPHDWKLTPSELTARRIYEESCPF